MTNTLFDALMAQHLGEARAALLLPDGRTLGYDELCLLSARLANLLSAKGVRSGDRVAAKVDKSAEALALYLATLRVGAVFLPLNNGSTVAEMGYFLGDAEPAVLVCDPSGVDGVAEIATEGMQILTLDAAGRGSLMTAAIRHPERHDPVPRAGHEPAAILYTSGTTGRPKGAVLSHDNLLSNARVLVDAWRFTSQDILLHALPIFHTHGLFVACNVMLLAGGAMIWLPKFDADEIIRLLPQATAMMGVPTFYSRLLERGDLTRDLTARMRLFTSGSAPLPAAAHRAFQDRTGHRILERYGMTETGMSTSNPYEGERRAGTVGTVLPGVALRIRDDQGRPAAPGAIGMIEVRGPNVFQEYWRMPDKTAEDLAADGWFTTGDLGMQDADGYLTIVGRSKDLVISGGHNVYPKEIEEAIDLLDGVPECAVIGVAHADLGEAVVAVVARRGGDDPDPQAILAALAERLARYKLPRHVVVVDDLPRNGMGKVQKAVLRSMYDDLFRS